MRFKKGSSQLPAWLTGVLIILVVFIMIIVWLIFIKGEAGGLLDRVTNIFGILPFLLPRIRNKKGAGGLTPRLIAVMVLLFIGVALVFLFVKGALPKSFDAVKSIFAFAP